MAKFLHVPFLSLSPDELPPGTKKIVDRYDILEAMATDKILPVIEHMLSVYKTWYGYRDDIPKRSRYTLGDKIDLRFIQVLELLQIATYQNPSEKLNTLDRAVSGIDTLKFLLKIIWEIRVFDDKKYLTLSEGLHEAGRQVGGWRKGIQTKTSAK